uniref:Acr-2 protein n=1 Tax=Neurospora crassa TaxID=5141 RepID=A2MY43_NEUCS|nr:probable acr-2 regulatory leader protein - Neurospora crassa [Neurospora crassa]BAA08307.1 acr-2 [Neurospora crassa]
MRREAKQCLFVQSHLCLWYSSYKTLLAQDKQTPFPGTALTRHS